MKPKLKIVDEISMSNKSRGQSCPVCKTGFSKTGFQKVLIGHGWTKEEVGGITNGAFSFALKAGLQITKTIEITGDKTVDFTKNFDALKDWTKEIDNKMIHLDEKRKEIDEVYKNLDEKRSTQEKEMSNKRAEIEKTRNELEISQKKYLIDIEKKRKEVEKRTDELDKRKDKISELEKTKLQEIREKEDHEREKRIKEFEHQKRELEGKEIKLRDLEKNISDKEKLQLPKTVNENLEKIMGDLKASQQEMKEFLNTKIEELSLKPKMSGNLQELQITRALRQLNSGDNIIPKGGKNEEDVLIELKENGRVFSKIVLDSKKVSGWNKNYLKQIERYMDKERASIGIIATSTMPKEAVDQLVYQLKDNVLVVNNSVLEATYILVRYALRKSMEEKVGFEKKLSLLEKKKKGLEVMQEVLKNADFKSIQRKLNDAKEEVEKSNETINKFRTYANSSFENLKTINENVIKFIDLSLDMNLNMKTAFERAGTVLSPDSKMEVI